MNLKGVKVWLLVYPHDMVLVVDEAKQMQEMINSPSRYLKREGLELNHGKSKMQIFMKGGREGK